LGRARQGLEPNRAGYAIVTDLVVGECRRMPRIIMIDDDVEFIELVDDALMARGCVITYADNGEEGIRLARLLQPDVVLLDIRMPGVDGYEVATRMRSDPQLKRIRIVAVTGLTMEDTEEQLRAGGFDGYVAKPVDLDVFISEIERFLDRPFARPEADG
jgi:CheY-like chemotaxis protein